MLAPELALELALALVSVLRPRATKGGEGREPRVPKFIDEPPFFWPFREWRNDARELF